MRCRACDSVLSIYETTLKRTIPLGDGQTMEVYEDLCGRCRGEIQGVVEDEGDDSSIDELLEE